MSLYDDIDPGLERRADRAPGWGSSNIKLLQSQMRLKKATNTQSRRDSSKKTSALAPVINLKTKKEEEDVSCSLGATLANFALPRGGSHLGLSKGAQFLPFGPDYNVTDEYDPLRPNDFEKLVREMRRERDRERERERKERRNAVNSDEELEKEETRKRSSTSGAAIAPPSFLQQNSGGSPPPAVRPGATPGGSVAAQIMARYGYKDGQGLGKTSQGIARALEVEKTSKRGGRIIHEKEKAAAAAAAQAAAQAAAEAAGPALAPPVDPEEMFAMPAPPIPVAAALMPPPAMLPPSLGAGAGGPSEPTMAEILRCPTKVVLLRNMVGAGEVDDELEGETKEECSTKYGDVVKVLIFELPGAPDVEAVRIFVEFRRIENAIKALVDLNGRFFGGRQVRARFYKQELFAKLQLNEQIP